MFREEPVNHFPSAAYLQLQVSIRIDSSREIAVTAACTLAPASGAAARNIASERVQGDEGISRWGSGLPTARE